MEKGPWSLVAPGTGAHAGPMWSIVVTFVASIVAFAGATAWLVTHQ
jgi:hypothetical protein